MAKNFAGLPVGTLLKLTDDRQVKLIRYDSDGDLVVENTSDSSDELCFDPDGTLEYGDSDADNLTIKHVVGISLKDARDGEEMTLADGTKMTVSKTEGGRVWLVEKDSTYQRGFNFDGTHGDGQLKPVVSRQYPADVKPYAGLAAGTKLKLANGHVATVEYYDNADDFKANIGGQTRWYRPDGTLYHGSEAGLNIVGFDDENPHPVRMPLYTNLPRGTKLRLSDGSIVTLNHYDRDGDLRVATAYGSERCYTTDGRRFGSSTDASIIGVVPSAVTSPLLPDIQAAEKALADLKAKAQAHAAAAAKPAMAIGQRWKRADGEIVTLCAYTGPTHEHRKFQAQSGLWYWADHQTDNEHGNPGRFTNQTLVELMPQLKRRWYTLKEFVTFCNTLPRLALRRKLGCTSEAPLSIQPYVSSTRHYFSCAGDDVTSTNFEQFEYSTDGGDSWKKFGIEE